jgi:hypothetical protein
MLWDGKLLCYKAFWMLIVLCKVIRLKMSSNPTEHLASWSLNMTSRLNVYRRRVFEDLDVLPQLEPNYFFP